MRCEQIRESWSARIDGEASPVPSSLVDAHVDACASCQAFVQRASRVDRELPVRPRMLGRPAMSLVRIGLVVVAVAQIALAVPGLIFGADEGAPIHIAHEVGAWDLALAIGLLFAAARPLRAVGMLPFAAALSVGLVLTAVVDIVNGRQPALFEIAHLMELAGTTLLWMLTAPRPRRSLRVV